jgi:uncharacterized protein (DUF302 family)
MNAPAYGFVARLAGRSFEQAIEQVTAALREEGFGVLTEIDVAQTLHRKLDVSFRPYRILGACNPELAHRALVGEPHIGLLLPCNVVVQQAPDDDTILVSIADPRVMFESVGNDEVAPVAEEAERRLRRVIEALG